MLPSPEPACSLSLLTFSVLPLLVPCCNGLPGHDGNNCLTMFFLPPSFSSKCEKSPENMEYMVQVVMSVVIAGYVNQ